MLKSPLEFLRQRRQPVRSIDDAAQFGVPVLGSIPAFDPHHGTRLPSSEFPEALEAYNRLAEVVSRPAFSAYGRTIVVTSSCAGEGKSTLAENLATLLASSRYHVILVDADVRSVTRRKPGDGTSSSGFAGLLVNQLMRPGKTLQGTPNPRMRLLPAGSIASSPDRLLQSSRLTRVVDGLREEADYVIFDVAPVSPSLSDLARHADVTLLALRSGVTSREGAARAVAILRESAAGLLGIVLNRAPVVLSVPRSEPHTHSIMAHPARPSLAETPLAISLDELLADLEESLRLIRRLRQGSADEAETAASQEADEAELVTTDR